MNIIHLNENYKKLFENTKRSKGLGNDREAYLPGAGNRAGKLPKNRDPGREVKLSKLQINVCRTL